MVLQEVWGYEQRVDVERDDDHMGCCLNYHTGVVVRQWGVGGVPVPLWHVLHTNPG